MAEVLFYHLERASLKQVLPDLLEKTLQRGWRAEVRCGSPERVAELDAMLWTYREDSFLPHGSDDSERQPIFLTVGSAPEGAQVLFLIDGAQADQRAIERLERCVVIIDGADGSMVERSRAFWKAVRASGVDATYWKQSEAGRWERHA